VVCGDNHICDRIVKRRPDRLHLAVASLKSRAESRVMPVGKGAEGGMRSEVRSKPLFLGGARSDDSATVDDHDVPGAQVITVVSHRRVPCGRPEILKVTGSARREILVISRGGLRACEVPPPGGRVADREFSVGALLAGVGSSCQDSAGVRVYKFRGGLCSSPGTG